MLAPGDTISHYKVLEKLEGGMGVVFKARDTRLDRVVALKVLPGEKLADPERRRLFVQEAKTASALNHPNIAVIHDIDEADGIFFMAMELVEGQPLDRLICPSGMPVNQALDIGIQLAGALDTAHKAGVVHRDLKPGNIVVGSGGRAKLLDFGLAKLNEAELLEAGEAAQTAIGATLTADGMIVGTIGYMAPEQAEARPVDNRSDIFTFGTILYEMVTGVRAFKRETHLSTLAAILREEPRPASEVRPEVSPELGCILSRCLRKDPEERFQTMAAVKAALEELREESQAGRAAPGRAARIRKPWLWIAIAGFLLAAAVAVFFSFRARP